MIQIEARPSTTTGVAKELGSKSCWNHTNTEFPPRWTSAVLQIRRTQSFQSMGCRGETIATTAHCCTVLLQLLGFFCTIINDFIMNDDVLETEDAWTEYCLPKIWVKCVHAYTADTRLSSPPPCALGEPGNEANIQLTVSS